MEHRAAPWAAANPDPRVLPAPPPRPLSPLSQQERLLDRLVQALTPRLRATPLRTAAALALALSNAGYYDPAFYAAAAAAAAADVGSLDAGEVPVLATALAAAFSTAGHYDERLFDALASKVGAGGWRRRRGAQGRGVRLRACCHRCMQLPVLLHARGWTRRLISVDPRQAAAKEATEAACKLA